MLSRALCSLALVLTAASCSTSGVPRSGIQADLFTTAPLFVDPHGPAVTDAAAASSRGDVTDAAVLRQLARYPTADWFTGGSPSQVEQLVDRRVSEVHSAGDLPVLVLYDIPHRDCGLYSAGGASGDAGYRAWIRGAAAGIADRSAVVVVEPDALAHLTDCLDAAGQRDRLADLRYAVSTLSALAATSVYLDAGSSGWHTAAEMAGRLREAGVTSTRGFALNTSDFKLTSQVLSFGHQLSKLLGGKHFIVDTSRNGAGPLAGQSWCMPAGRALGLAPGTPTGDSVVDAYVWIKNPGRSDGSCDEGAPAAGVWDRSYAVALLRRAMQLGSLAGQQARA